MLAFRTLQFEPVIHLGQFRLTFLALGTTQRQAHMAICRRADGVQFVARETTRLHERIEQTANGGIDTLLAAQRRQFLRQRIQLVRLFAQLGVEPVAACFGGRQLLNELEFLATRVAHAGLIRRGHAAQRVQFDEHRLDAALGLRDGVFDLLRIMLGALAQLDVQCVDAIAQRRVRRLFAVDALAKRLVFLFQPTNRSLQAFLVSCAMCRDARKLGLQCSNAFPRRFCPLLAALDGPAE